MSLASSISAAMDEVPSKKERLHKAFLELQSHSSALVNFSVQWKELEDHFNDLEKRMQKRLEELREKEKENEKEKSAAEKSTKNGNKTPEKKSTAEKSTGNPHKTTDKKSAAGKSTGNANKSSEKKAAGEKCAVNPNETSEKNSGAENSTKSSHKNLPELKEDVKPRPELKSLCENMDAEGLKEFLGNSRSELTAIRKEAPAALRCAPDPANLVLQTLKGFYPDGKQTTNIDAQRHACVLLLESLPFVLSPEEVSSEAKKEAQKIAAKWKFRVTGMISSGSPITNVRIHAFLHLLASYGISKEFKDDDLCELVLLISRDSQTPELCRALQLTHKIPDVVEKLRSQRQMDALRFVFAFGLEEKFPPVPLLKAYLEHQRKASEEIAKKGRDHVGSLNSAASKEIHSLNNVIKCIEVHKLESQMPTKDLQKRVAQLQKDMEERKRSAEAIRTETKRARLNSDNGGGGVGGAVAGSLFPKTTPSSAFALPNSSSLLPKTTPPSTFALSNSSSLLPTKPTHPSAFAPSNFSDLQRPAPIASIPPYNLPGQGVYDRGSQDISSIPSYNLPGQGVYDRGSQDIYRSAYDVGKNTSSLSRSQLYPSESLQSSLYGAGSYHGSTNYGNYNIGSGVPPATSYQSSYLR